MQNEVISRERWLEARAELLEMEKNHTRARDALATARRQLPWVRLEKEYRFTGPEGESSLADLFADRRQLVIYHLMFGAGWRRRVPAARRG